MGCSYSIVSITVDWSTRSWPPSVTMKRRPSVGTGSDMRRVMS